MSRDTTRQDLVLSGRFPGRVVRSGGTGEKEPTPLPDARSVPAAGRGPEPCSRDTAEPTRLGVRGAVRHQRARSRTSVRHAGVGKDLYTGVAVVSATWLTSVTRDSLLDSLLRASHNRTGMRSGMVSASRTSSVS